MHANLILQLYTPVLVIKFLEVDLEQGNTVFAIHFTVKAV